MTALYLHFDTPLARANQLAEELQTHIRNTCKVDLPRVKADPNTMDAGSVLTIALTAPTLVAVAQGIRTWLSKKNNIKIVFKDEKNTIIGSGLSGKDLPTFFEGAAQLLKNEQPTKKDEPWKKEHPNS
jgi:hypothetical protein